MIAVSTCKICVLVAGGLYIARGGCLSRCRAVAHVLESACITARATACLELAAHLNFRGIVVRELAVTAKASTFEEVETRAIAVLRRRRSAAG